MEQGTSSQRANSIYYASPLIFLAACALLALIIGVLLVLLGIWLLAGKSLPIHIPQPNIDVSAHNSRSVFMYGLAYGFASLSCTLPIFLAVVGASLTSAGVAGMSVMFTAYGIGMAVVLMSVAIGAALINTTAIPIPSVIAMGFKILSAIIMGK